MASLPILEFIAGNYRNFNARATRDALFAWWDHLQGGGRMYLGDGRRHEQRAAGHHAGAGLP